MKKFVSLRELLDRAHDVTFQLVRNGSAIAVYAFDDTLPDAPIRFLGLTSDETLRAFARILPNHPESIHLPVNRKEKA